VELIATSIGKKAGEVLDRGGGFRIKGVTSRGVFLENETGWTLFLSGEEYRGPLTINLPDLFPSRRGFAIDMVGQVNGNIIDFQAAGLGVNLMHAKVWAYHPGEGGGRGVLDRKTAKIVQKSKHPVVSALLGREIELAIINEKLLEGFQAIPPLIRMKDYQGAVDKVSGILGLGEGLTPEGDDFVIGLLFYLRIANLDEDIIPGIDLMMKDILHEAEKKTTRLSVNMIECGAEGQVDERISQVVDSILTGEGFEESVNRLMTWGNTSGQMALAGIVAGALVGNSQL